LSDVAKLERFEDLDVWQRARRLTNLIYDLSDRGSFGRDYGLKNQMRRAAVSIMSNIAEGFESRSQALFIDYLGRAKASSGELRSQLYIAVDREYLSQDEFETAFELAETCSKQLARFIQYLESKPNARRIKEDTVTYEV
jgi:four helix bundle protein